MLRILIYKILPVLFQCFSFKFFFKSVISLAYDTLYITNTVLTVLLLYHAPVQIQHYCYSKLVSYLTQFVRIYIQIFTFTFIFTFILTFIFTFIFMLSSVKITFFFRIFSCPFHFPHFPFALEISRISILTQPWGP